MLPIEFSGIKSAVDTAIPLSAWRRRAVWDGYDESFFVDISETQLMNISFEAIFSDLSSWGKLWQQFTVNMVITENGIGVKYHYNNRRKLTFHSGRIWLYRGNNCVSFDW